MKIKLLVLFVSFLLLSFIGIVKKELLWPSYFPKPIYDLTFKSNTQNQINLGRALFYDPILSEDNSISCASCHNVYTAFAHTDHALSHGIYDRIGKRNAPALFNLAWQKSFMWDGAINHIEVQALAPISHPSEMNEEIGHLVEKLRANAAYQSKFSLAFGDTAISSSKTLQALAQFLLHIVTWNSKYDSVQRGERSFTTQENKGYQLFQKHCNSCHLEPLFTNHLFKNNGLLVDSNLKDFGRVVVSLNPSDSFSFKVPSLRNIEYTYPYMHDGRIKTLSEVLNHYTHAKGMNSKADLLLKKGLPLSSKDKVDIIAFLLTLSDRSFLFNPNYNYPKNNF